MKQKLLVMVKLLSQFFYVDEICNLNHFQQLRFILFPSDEVNFFGHVAFPLKANPTGQDSFYRKMIEIKVVLKLFVMTNHNQNLHTIYTFFYKMQEFLKISPP